MFHALQIMGLALLTTAPSPVPSSAPSQATAVEVGAAADVPQRAGLTVVVDPVTGKLIDNPTHLQLESVSEGVTLERRRSSWELREFFLSGGGRGVYLDGWADHSLTVEITPDGEMKLGCSQGDEHPQPHAATDAEPVR